MRIHKQRWVLRMSKKKRYVIILSVAIVLIVSLIAILALKKMKKNQKGVSEIALMNAYLEMILEHKQYADTLFTDTSDQAEGTGFFGNGGGQKMRTSNNYTLYYAFLFTELHGTKYLPEDGAVHPVIQNKEEFLREVKEKALAGIRYGVYTHNSVKKMETIPQMATDQEKWWGPNNWQSSLYANSLLLAASFMWDHIDENLKKDIEKICESEGDRAVRTNPRNYVPGNTGAEENAWDTNGPALAYNLFPNHKKASSWNESAIKFAMNTFSREMDKQDKTKIDGKPVSEWLTTVNIFDDYSLENHNILHPVYLMSPLISFADSAVAYAYHGREIPAAFTYNVKEVADNVLKKLVYPTGEWAYPNGCDWTMILPGKSEAFAYLSVMFNDPEARLLEERSVKMAMERQNLTGDGRFVDIADIGIEREAVNVKRIIYSYLIHKYIGNQPAKSISWDEFIESNKGTLTYLDGYVVTNNSQNRFASISWKNKYMGLITPNSDGYLENGYVTHPNLPNIVGSFAVTSSQEGRSYGLHKTYMVGEELNSGLYPGFSSLGYLLDNGGDITRYISMTVLPTNAVIVMDNTVAERDLNIRSGYVVPLSFQTDITSGLMKNIYTEKGKDAFEAGQRIHKEYRSSYVNVDNHTGVILDKPMYIQFGDYKISSGIGGSTMKFLIEPGKFNKGENINSSTFVIYSNVKNNRLLDLQKEISYLALPKGWQGLVVKDTDNVCYYVVNNFYGEEGNYEIEGEDFAPLILEEITVKGKEARIKLKEGMASYTGVLSKYLKTDGQEVSVRNSAKSNVFYVKNPGSGKVTVTVKFDIKGKTSEKKFAINGGETYMVSYEGGKIKEKKIEVFPSAPDQVANVNAELKKDKVVVSWSKVDNAYEYIVSRVDSSGKYEEVGKVKGEVTKIEDTAFQPGVNYRYCVVAVDKYEGFTSKESFSDYVSTGPYVDSTGRVNLAYNKPSKFVHGTQGAYLESLAVDDDVNTFTVNNDFLPTSGDPEYFEIDLLGKYLIDEIVLLPRITNAGYGPKDVEFYYTLDGENFNLLGKKLIRNTHDASINSIKFDAVYATQVRIKITSSYSVKNVQIAEVRIYESK